MSVYTPAPSWTYNRAGGGTEIERESVGRYRVTFEGPGGHSWGAFGTANPAHAMSRAVRYFQDFVKPAKTYRAPTDNERAALADLQTRLTQWQGGADAEELQNLVFAVGNEHAFEPLRDWFKAIYEVLLGASQGPRFGGFIALYGVAETIALIDSALAGDLAAA